MSVQTYFYHKKNYIAPGVHEDLYLVKKDYIEKSRGGRKNFCLRVCKSTSADFYGTLILQRLHQIGT